MQFGGQTPLKLAQSLDAHNVPILGTSPDAIDLAEDRDRFKALVEKLKLRQPKNGIAYSVEQALLASEDIGFPIVVRPSYVLGGRAMAILPDQATLKDYFDTTLAAFVPPDLQHRFAGNRHAQVNAVLAKNALLLDSYVRDAIEVDVDAICDGEDVFIAGVMEHIEEAGVHSWRQRLLASAALALRGNARRVGASDRGHCARAQCRRPYERAIRDQGQGCVRTRGQSTRQPHRAVRG